jgi:hypothetical protein
MHSRSAFRKHASVYGVYGITEAEGEDASRSDIFPKLRVLAPVQAVPAVQFTKVTKARFEDLRFSDTTSGTR